MLHFQVLPYDPAWPEAFEKTKSELQAILSNVDIVSIEHVGSTSVPGLAAKPFIDIDIVVTRPALPSTISALTSNGFVHKGEMGVPDRHIIRREVTPAGEFKRNIYICIQGSLALKNHLALRSVLRENDELRDEYGKVKMELAEKEWVHVDDYTRSKNKTVFNILQKAGLTDEELAEIKKHND